jgi:hypothetical protein
MSSKVYKNNGTVHSNVKERELLSNKSGGDAVIGGNLEFLTATNDALLRIDDGAAKSTQNNDHLVDGLPYSTHHSLHSIQFCKSSASFPAIQ